MMQEPSHGIMGKILSGLSVISDTTTVVQLLQSIFGLALPGLLLTRRTPIVILVVAGLFGTGLLAIVMLVRRMKSNVASHQLIKHLRLIVSQEHEWVFPDAQNIYNTPWATLRIWWDDLLGKRIQRLVDRRHVSRDELKEMWNNEICPFIGAARTLALNTEHERNCIQKLKPLEDALISDPIDGVRAKFIEFYFNKHP